ncbi:hypothetical protein D320_19592 [Haloferax sp. BAB-2207]|nr:hypothetical protein D320_19592 [Haloferax sp. BAB-2207]
MMALESLSQFGQRYSTTDIRQLLTELAMDSQLSLKLWRVMVGKSPLQRVPKVEHDLRLRGESRTMTAELVFGEHT